MSSLQLPAVPCLADPVPVPHTRVAPVFALPTLIGPLLVKGIATADCAPGATLTRSSLVKDDDESPENVVPSLRFIVPAMTHRVRCHAAGCAVQCKRACWSRGTRGVHQEAEYLCY